MSNEALAQRLHDREPCHGDECRHTAGCLCREAAAALREQQAGVEMTKRESAMIHIAAGLLTAVRKNPAYNLAGLAREAAQITDELFKEAAKRP